MGVRALLLGKGAVSIFCNPSGPGNNDNEEVLYIPQSSSITGGSTSDCFISYPGSSFSEMHLVYSANLAVLSLSIYLSIYLWTNTISGPFSRIKRGIYFYKEVCFVRSLNCVNRAYTTLSGATIPGQSGLGSDSNERVHHIPQSSSITRSSPSDCFVSYPGHSMQTVYSTAPDDWSNNALVDQCLQIG